jgi:hypothetical protein
MTSGRERAMRIIFAIVATVAVAVTTTARADPCSEDDVTKQDGACWNSLAPAKKSAVVEGIWAGIRASGLNAGLLDPDGRSSYSFDHLDNSWPNDNRR